MNINEAFTALIECLQVNVRDSIGVHLIYPAPMVRPIDRQVMAERNHIIEIMNQLNHISSLPYPSPHFPGVVCLIRNLQRAQQERRTRREDVQGPFFRSPRAA